MKSSAEAKIYFDNAATSFPKPTQVAAAMVEFLGTCGNPGRGAHHFAVQGARRIFEARQALAQFLGITECERLIFTPGCTASINMVLKGLFLDGFFTKGDRVIISSIEHNSVMRPLEQLKKQAGITVDVLETGDEFLGRLAAMVESKPPRMVVLNWASNVTGELLPVLSVAAFLKERSIPLLVDGAQVAGKFDIDLASSGINFFCASGHKGLMGPPGVGLLYVAPGFDFSPLIAGGTGSRSESFAVPDAYPDHLEAGTQAGPLIAGLAQGVEWLRSCGSMDLLKHELALTESFLDWAKSAKAVSIYGPRQVFDENWQPLRMPVISFALDGITPADLAAVLDTEYGIATRAGLHCSSLCHKRLGTISHGLVRVSFGPQNQEWEVKALCTALDAISKELSVR